MCNVRGYQILAFLMDTDFFCSSFLYYKIWKKLLFMKELLEMYEICNQR